MKKITIIFAGVFICLASMAQNSLVRQQSKVVKVKSPLKNICIPVPKFNDANNGALPVVKHAHKAQPTLQLQLSPSETVIGNTYYDLQTNSGICNRFINHSNGTMTATWTFSPTSDASAAYPNRGTGYNYFDGSTWGSIPSARIETFRSGWPNVMTTSSGKETVITHSSVAIGMLMTQRNTTGTGAWTDYPNIFGNFADDTWSKSVSGGTNGNTIHSIWNGSGISGTAYNGQKGPIYYNRSTDEGATWPVSRAIITGLDSSKYFGFGGDDYSIDARGDTVAIVAGSFATDVVLMKSTDNGTSWTQTIIDSFPVRLFDSATMLTDADGDGIADTLFSGSGDNQVIIDNNGMCHVFFSVVRVLCDDPGTAAGQGLSFFPFTDGLFYWNETFGPDSVQLIAAAQDFDGDGFLTTPVPSSCNGAVAEFPFGVYRGGLTQMPSAGIDANNNIYLSYQSFDELTDTLNYQKGYKHIYVIASGDNGATWTVPIDIVRQTQPVSGNQLEGVFASFAKRVDSNIHLIYQRDVAPGHGVYATSATQGCDYVNNNGNLSNIIYYSVPTSEILGVQSADNNITNTFSVSPNPSSDEITLSFKGTEIKNAAVTVCDILGKTVRDFGNNFNGHARYSVRGLDAGMYFINVRTNKGVVTQRFEVAK